MADTSRKTYRKLLNGIVTEHSAKSVSGPIYLASSCVLDKMSVNSITLTGIIETFWIPKDQIGDCLQGDPL